MVNLLLEWYRSWRMQRANRADISDKACVACDSIDITSQSPGVYLCSACGYEGGSGHATMRKEQRLAQFDKLSPEERHKSATDDLHQARQLLMSGIGYFDSAISYSWSDRNGLAMSEAGQGQGAEKFSDFTQGAKLIQEAKHLLEDAMYKLQQHPEGSLSFDVEIDYSKWLLDLHFDNMFSNIKSHQRIVAAKGQAEATLNAVEDTLRRSFQFRDLSTTPP